MKCLSLLMVLISFQVKAAQVEMFRINSLECGQEQSFIANVNEAISKLSITTDRNVAFHAGFYADYGTGGVNVNLNEKFRLEVEVAPVGNQLSKKLVSIIGVKDPLIYCYQGSLSCTVEARREATGIHNEKYEALPLPFAQATQLLVKAKLSCISSSSGDQPRQLGNMPIRQELDTKIFLGINTSR